jgi:hypothetical protein
MPAELEAANQLNCRDLSRPEGADLLQPASRKSSDSKEMSMIG